MDHVHLRYGGGWEDPAEVFVNGGELTLTDSIISESARAGLRIVKSNPTVADCTFENNTWSAVSMD